MHAAGRRDRTDRGSDAARKSAAAPGNDNRLDVRQVLHDLESDGAIAGHDVRIVERVDESAVDTRVARSWKVCHQRSKGALMTRPPRRSIAASFAAGAVSGAITVQGIPRSRAHQATPCAMLPADAVSTPRASCCGGMFAIALAAPRILKDPIGWRFSSFSQISAGASWTLSRTSGVLSAIPARRSRACRMSARVGSIVDADTTRNGCHVRRVSSSRPRSAAHLSSERAATMIRMAPFLISDS